MMRTIFFGMALATLAACGVEGPPTAPAQPAVSGTATPGIVVVN